MSTLSEREAALRRALQSAAARIEPAPDGLERIQARLRRPRPVAIAWLEAAWTDIYLRAQPVVVGWLEAARTDIYPRARDGVQTAAPVVADGVRRVWARFAPTSEPGRALPLRWLRPLAAMSLAIFVIGAGTYVGLSGSALFQAGNSQNSGIVNPGGSGPGGQGNRGPAGSGTPISQSGQPFSSPSPSGCTNTPKPSYSAPPSSVPSGSPTPSGSTTPTGSPTPTPTPSPSSSTSATPNPAGTSATGTGTVGAAHIASAADTGQHSSTASASAARTATASASSRRHRTANHPTSTPSPCPSRTTAAAGPPALLWPPVGGAISTAGAHLTTAGLEPTVAGARLNRSLAA